MSAMPPFQLTRPTDALPASSVLPPAQPSAAPPPAPMPNTSAVINPTWQTAMTAKRATFQKSKGREPTDAEMLDMEKGIAIDKFTTADQRNNATPAQMAQSTDAGNAAGQPPTGYQGTGPGGKSLLATLPRNSTPSAAPMFDPATGATQAGMINDANNGITSRGGGTVTTQGGGIITNQTGGTKSLSSPYGSGSVTFAPPGTKPPGDPNLRAMNAYLNQYDPYDKSVDWSKQPGAAGMSDDAINAQAGGDRVKAAHLADARAMQRREILAGKSAPTAPSVPSAAPPAVASAPPVSSTPRLPVSQSSAPPIPIDQNIAQARSATNVMQAVNQKWAQANAPAPQTIQGIQTAKPAFMTAAPPPTSTTTASAPPVSPSPVLNSASSAPPAMIPASQKPGDASVADVIRKNAGLPTSAPPAPSFTAPRFSPTRPIPASQKLGDRAVANTIRRNAAPPPPPRSLVLR